MSTSPESEAAGVITADAEAPPAETHVETEPHLHAEHFVLAPEVAARPLALRRRRLVAILVDVTLITLITTVFDRLGPLVATAVGALVYWATGRVSSRLAERQGVRMAIALSVCLACAVAGLLLSDNAAEQGHDLGLRPGAMALDLSELKDLRELKNEDEDEDDDQGVSAPAPPPPVPSADSDATKVVALETEVSTLEAHVEKLEERLEEAEKGRGVLQFVKATAHDFGFGIGWSYVYFIGFLTLWNGFTPGKRLLGVRVLRVDGKPMTLWRAWERFHGYAASMLTGLLGFTQIFWDPSRQCLHDKVAETVVVRAHGVR